MKRAVTIVAVSAVATVALWVNPQLLVVLWDAVTREKPAVAYLGSPSKLGRAYETWVTEHEARGGDTNVTLALRWAKGLSVEFTRAYGQVRLDLLAGSVVVEASGLDDRAWEVWLVDNQPGPNRSVLPEPGDKMKLVGRLQMEEGVGRLQAELGRRAFTGFEVDLVVIARPGDDLGQRGVLFGAPSLFQRLYTRARTGQPLDPDEPAGPLDAWARRRDDGPTAVVASFDPLVTKGAELFFNETFNGNGRTCGTCHPAENNFTIDPKFIATLPPRDPLFVAEFVPALAENFENPKLMRKVGLILENLDGFDDLSRKFVMRSVPHILALNTSLTAAQGGADGTTTPPNERTGWSGDGSPGNGTLREFAIGAVTQHFTRTLARKPGTDFRLPTDKELDALEAFQRFVGRDRDPDLASMKLKGEVARRGKEIFLATDTQKGTVVAGKCQTCHANGGATVSFIPGGFNFNFATGVEQLVDPPGDLVDRAKNPPDGGFGRTQVSSVPGFGTGTFNTPPLIEAADTPPFFHNNALNTIEEAVNFFNSVAFANSPSGQFLASTDSGGIGIHLEPTHVQALAAFLRVLNALENMRTAHEMQTFVLNVRSDDVARSLLKLSTKEQQDAVEVLEQAGLHPVAVERLRKSIERATQASATSFQSARNALIRQAMADQQAARRDLIDE
jgi:cytochrome c peroxidase